MYYTSKKEETIFVSAITPDKMYMFREDLGTGLTIIWNIGKKATFYIDKQILKIETDCIFFLTEFHKITSYDFEMLNVIQFNREFHCVEDHDSEIGCKGLLFFGASVVPKIKIPNEQLIKYQTLWTVLEMEMEEKDDFKLEMLRSILQRYLILCIRQYREENFNTQIDNTSIQLIREYNFLVEQHFRIKTQVRDYAEMLYKSPKTLSNLFSKFIDKTPLQIINERRLLEAKRMLQYTDAQIQEISDELSFSDVQAFSNFIKKHTNRTPSAIRLSR